jgi:hypothetical protein
MYNFFNVSNLLASHSCKNSFIALYKEGQKSTFSFINIKKLCKIIFLKKKTLFFPHVIENNNYIKIYQKHYTI